MKKILYDWRIWLMASLSLGLAPFTPPHIWGKLVWVAGGAVGMAAKDWFDLFFHGTPWILLITSLFLNGTKKMMSPKTQIRVGIVALAVVGAVICLLFSLR